MPELPDVECLRHYFKRTSLGKKITDVECRDARLLSGVKPERLRRRLLGRSFQKVSRRGKFLIVQIDRPGEKLIFHFGMTGDLHYVRQGREETGLDRFTRTVFRFKNQCELRWINPRKLGRIYMPVDSKLVPLLGDLGPEPLTLSRRLFLQLIRKHDEKNVKAFMLDQRTLAGIGNVYADEILFRGRISPQRKLKTLSTAEKVDLFRSMREVLREAVQRRPPMGMLYGAFWLLPERKRAVRCPRDGRHRLIRQKIVGRTTVYCPSCQPIGFF
jgi:formamidopyrimidine-DNA glycosylase